MTAYPQGEVWVYNWTNYEEHTTYLGGIKICSLVDRLLTF